MVPTFHKGPRSEPKRNKQSAKNAPQFELHSELQRIVGVDLTRIDGIDVMVAQTLVSEVGSPMFLGRLTVPVTSRVPCPILFLRPVPDATGDE